MKPQSQYIAPRLAGFGPKLAWKVRSEIYSNLIKKLRPNPEWRVLDAGVTSDRTADSNFFERLYPYPQSLIAIGLEDASFLEKQYPGIKFILADVRKIPFEDNSFDLAFCSAVIEHVGSRQEQCKLLQELARVSKIAVITTPNRFFPIEFHTLTPFLHWLPVKFFRHFLTLTGREFFAAEKNLNLLSESDIDAMLRQCNLAGEKNHHYLLGLKSNLVYYISNR
jgi:hypothetical protein